MPNPIKDFSLKFIDMMVGVVLGLGLQWWPNLQEPWQFIAFIFVYLFLIDYWIDYGPSLKKFPPKKEIDVILDVILVFFMFFCIYSTLLTIWNFLISFALLFIFDFFWLLSSKMEYHPVGKDKIFVDIWMLIDLLCFFFTLVIFLLGKYFAVSSLNVLIIFIILNIFLRILAIWKYKKVYFS
jgi:hypothetical protein